MEFDDQLHRLQLLLLREPSNQNHCPSYKFHVLPHLKSSAPLYEHQLKQILRCINTIQKNKLTGVQYTKLITLSQELHFQKRLNKVQKSEKNYYPQLNLEYGAPMTERSYYQIR